MLLAFALPPAIAGEKTVTISRNDISQLGVYYCDKGGVTMTFTSGMNNPNYLVEHQQVVFYIRSNNYVIKKIVFHCLDNTTENDLDAFYWGPSTISEEGEVGSYTPTGTYTYTPGGYIGTWVAGPVDSKNVAFTTKGRPVRFGSVEITYDKDTGDIYDLVRSINQIQVGEKYVIVSQRAKKAMSPHQVSGLVENGVIPKTTMGSTSVSFVDESTYEKVIVNEDVMILTLESNPSTVSNTMRPFMFRYGDQYLRRNSAVSGSDASPTNYTYGHNLSLASYETATDKMYFPFNISFGTNSNAMMSYIQRGATQESEPTSSTYSIRYHNGSNFFRVLNWSTTSNTYAANQRVYLYRPAENFKITTKCLPADQNCGYITLGDGVLELDGHQTSQEYENVHFFVGPTDGYGIGQVTMLNKSTGEVTILDPTSVSDFGNDYSFVMPASDVEITANFVQPYDIHTVINPNDDSGSFEFIDGYTDFNGHPMSNEGKTVIFKPVAADGYTFTSVTGVDDVTGQPLNITLDADGNYSFEMPGNSVTLTANFDLIPYYVITTECRPSDAGRIDVYDGVTTVDNAITAMPGNVVTFWVEHYNDNVIQSVTVTREGVTEPVALNELDSNEYGRRYSFTMPTGNVHIVATFEPYNDLYLLGTAMGRTDWCPSGPKFNFDATNNEYYLDVYFKGGNNDANVDQAFGYFSLASTVSNFDWTHRGENSSDWSGVSGRLAATSNNYPVDGTSTDVYLSGNANETNNFDNAFKIPAGVYRITVNRAKNRMSIVETPLQLTFDPVSGSIVAQGTVVTIDSDLEDVVHAIASSYGMTEDSQKFRNTTDDVDDNPTWVSDDNDGENGAQATINQDGTTVSAEAWIGYIVVPGTATYHFADYNITWICTPEVAGSVTVAGTAQEGATVTFSVDTNEGYTLSSVVVVNNNDPTAEPLELTDNGNGTYSFTMPADDVVIKANFSEKAYDIHTIVTPDNGGTINVQNQALAGETVNFTVDANTGFALTNITILDDQGNEVPFEENLDDTGSYDGTYSFTMPAADVTVTAYLQQNSPLSYIERPGTYGDGDEVTVTDQLIGTWAAQKYLWAKDQAPYVSNFYLEKNPENESLHDYHREFFMLQYRDWDQSNWVMLDFSTIPELAGYSQQQLMAVMNNYVDNQIEAGSIKGTYRCMISESCPFDLYDGPIKVQHVIELSELPRYVKDPATIGSNNTLGYPGFKNDPQEKDGKYYGNPKASYAYNHYSPANFLLENTSPDGVTSPFEELDHEENGNIFAYQWFFMRPKDQEVVQVWAVWLGEIDYVDDMTHEQRTDSVFAVYNSEDGYNSLGIHGAFRVDSWDYNVNKTDENGKPTGYGQPVGDLRKDFDYTFHAVIKYSSLSLSGPTKKAPAKAPMVDTDATPEFYNVYPLDMTSPGETYTGVREVVSRDATKIVDIRYYNIMGQESTTPFDGINIMVVRYKDGSMTSTKILK